MFIGTNNHARRVAKGGIGGQIPLSMEKFVHFARIFEKK